MRARAWAGRGVAHGLPISPGMTTTMQDPTLPIDARAERVLEVALDEFARRGFRGARETVIARRAGMALATLRSYFPTKEALFREVVRSTLVTALEPGPERPADPDAAAEVRRLAGEFWRAMERPDHLALLRLSMGELPGFPELALFHTTEVIGRSAARLERTLARGMARGQLRMADPRTTARVVLSALVMHAHWLALPAVYGGFAGADRAATEQAVLRAILDLLSPAREVPHA